MIASQIKGGRRSWGLLLVLVAISLITVGFSVDWHHLSIDSLDGSLNDQVGYISVARNLVDRGALDSSLVYPVVLRQQVRRTSLYMPAYYWELAVTYKALGYSAVTSRLPSLIGFLLSIWLTFYIGTRLYSSSAAVLACTLFAVVPLGLVYAFTAMMEQSLVAAGLAAFALFVRAGERRRFWVGPLALLLPVLFRETGAIIGIVMLAVIIATKREGRMRVVLIAALLMAVVVVFALRSPLGAGRPSLWKANLLVGGNSEEVYGNAFATDGIPARASDWAVAVRKTFAENLRSLIRPAGESGFLEQSLVWFILSGIPLGAVLWFSRKDSFALGVSLAVTVLLMALLGVYSVWGYRGMRVLLILHPFVAIAWGAVLEKMIRARWAQAAFVIILFASGTWGAVHVVRSQASDDKETRENTSFMESVVKDRTGLLASPFWLSLDYVNQHYPQKWSFLPSNCETARLLDRRYHLGTVIMPKPEEDDRPSKPAEEYCGTGLRLAGTEEFDGTEFWIYRR